MTNRSPGSILIVGCRRSGTTLVRTILEEHPNLLVHPFEPQFFLQLYRRFGLDRIPPSSALAYILGHPYRAPEVTGEKLGAGDFPPDLTGIVHRYMVAWSSGHENRPKVLKHPAFVFHLDIAELLFPECTVIHVVRDPRASVSSQRQRWSHLSVWQCAMHWRRAVEAARAWYRKNAGRYIEIQYEELVQYPEESVRKLCASLSLPYSKQLLSFRQQETVFEPETGQQLKLYRAPDPSRIDLWREWLTGDDVQIVEAICSREMAWWRYPAVSSSVPSFALRSRMVRERIACAVHRLANRTAIKVQRFTQPNRIP
jgi:hypothetical protein